MPYEIEICLYSGQQLKFGGIRFNSLTHNKFLDFSNLKASADDKIDVSGKDEFISGRVENSIGKGAFSPFPIKLSKCYFFTVVNGRNCVINN